MAYKQWGLISRVLDTQAKIKDLVDSVSGGVWRTEGAFSLRRRAGHLLLKALIPPARVTSQGGPASNLIPEGSAQEV